MTVHSHVGPDGPFEHQHEPLGDDHTHRMARITPKGKAAVRWGDADAGADPKAVGTPYYLARCAIEEALIKAGLCDWSKRNPFSFAVVALDAIDYVGLLQRHAERAGAIDWEDIAKRAVPLVRHQDGCYGLRNFERDCDCGAYRVRIDFKAAQHR